jgi:hypothetical protein
MLPIRNDILDIKCGKDLIARFEVVSVDNDKKLFVLHLVEVRRGSDLAHLDVPKEEPNG